MKHDWKVRVGVTTKAVEQLRNTHDRFHAVDDRFGPHLVHSIVDLTAPTKEGADDLVQRLRATFTPSEIDFMEVTEQIIAAR